MSKAIQCDNCGAFLGGLDHNGEDDYGVVYGWIQLSVKDERSHIDACTVSCAHALLDGDFGATVTKKMLQVAEVAKVIRESREQREREEDDEDEEDD